LMVHPFLNENSVHRYPRVPHWPATLRKGGVCGKKGDPEEVLTPYPFLRAGSNDDIDKPCLYFLCQISPALATIRVE
jgi:hypothetical protein